jgi:hypothetical protein
MSDGDGDDLSEKDRAALELAIDLCLAGDPEGASRAEQVRDMLQGYRTQLTDHPPRPWREVAEFCASCQQSARLNLLVPCKTAPCDILTREAAEDILEEGFIPACNDPSVDISDCSTAQLLLDMLNAGVSAYHPNPLRALAEAKQMKKR